MVFKGRILPDKIMGFVGYKKDEIKSGFIK